MLKSAAQSDKSSRLRAARSLNVGLKQRLIPRTEDYGILRFAFRGQPRRSPWHQRNASLLPHFAPKDLR